MRNGIILFFMLVFPATAYNPERTFSPSQSPEELKGLEIEEKPGGFVDLDLSFTDEHGKSLKLRELFQDNRPVLLSIVYYACPNLCGLLMNGLSESLQNMPNSFKEEFRFVFVSMDDTETPTLALSKKTNYVKQYRLLEQNTHFLTGDKKNILALSKQVGFRFRWDDSQKIFAHLPVAYVLTPKAKISRYLYGVVFQERTVRLSLVEAGQGRTGTVLDRALLFCFQFDPKKRRYSWYAYNIMRAGGALTLFLLLCFLLPVWIRESKKKGAV